MARCIGTIKKKLKRAETPETNQTYRTNRVPKERASFGRTRTGNRAKECAKVYCSQSSGSAFTHPATSVIGFYTELYVKSWVPDRMMNLDFALGILKQFSWKQHFKTKIFPIIYCSQYIELQHLVASQDGMETGKGRRCLLSVLLSVHFKSFKKWTFEIQWKKCKSKKCLNVWIRGKCQLERPANKQKLQRGSTIEV